MASNEPLNKESVLSPALANAALLIAAPSLGCLRTFTKAFTDLCRVYGLHVPDLEDVLHYSPTASSSCEVRLLKTNCFLKPSQVIPNISEPKAQHIKIKKEPEDHECDTVKVKQEIVENNTALYNALLYDTNPTIQGTSLEKHVKKEEIQLEIPINNILEIPLEMKAKSNLFLTKQSTPGTSLEKHLKYENTQFEKPIDIALETYLKRKAESDVSDTKPCTKGASVNKYIKNKDKPIGIQFVHTIGKMEISLKSYDISKEPVQNQVGTSVNTDPYSTMLRDTTKSLTSPKSLKVRSNSSMLLFSPKTNVYSFLDSNGRKRYAPSSEDARKIMTQCGMPFKFANNNEDFKECSVYVDTIVEGPSTLHIWLKNESRDFIIPFVIIREISKFKNSIVICYSLNKCIEKCYLNPKVTFLHTKGTNARSKKTNIAATFNWLHKFLGKSDDMLSEHRSESF